MKRIEYIKYFAVVIMIFSMSSIPDAVAMDKNKQFEIGIGVGRDMHGLQSTNLLIIPAISWRVKGYDNLTLRLEGNLELIHRNNTTKIIGLAPLIRISSSRDGLKPFIEAGGGINFTSHEVVEGRNLGNDLLFSIMAGIGMSLNNSRYPKISISYRFRHLSNGGLNSGLRTNNSSFNSNYVVVSVGF